MDLNRRNFLKSSAAVSGAAGIKPDTSPLEKTLGIFGKIKEALGARKAFSRFDLFAIGSQIGFLSDEGLDQTKWPDFKEQLRKVEPEAIGKAFFSLSRQIGNPMYSSIPITDAIRNVYNWDRPDAKYIPSITEIRSSLGEFAKSENDNERRYAKALLRIFSGNRAENGEDSNLCAIHGYLAEASNNYSVTLSQRLTAAYEEVLSEHVASGKLKGNPLQLENVIDGNFSIEYKTNAFVSFDRKTTQQEKSFFEDLLKNALSSGSMQRIIKFEADKTTYFNPIRFDISLPRNNGEDTAKHIIRTKRTAEQIERALPEAFIEKISINGAGRIHLTPNYNGLKNGQLSGEYEKGFEDMLKQLKTRAEKDMLAAKPQQISK